MGCVNSRADINDLRPNVFQVINVDDSGNLITSGRLEVTDTDIVLYQRDKQPIKWPLRCLRRYGYDVELFSFESGRRCSTGPGIYAFKCRRAAHLFNLVQTNIQVCNNSGEDTISRELPVVSHTGAALPRVTIPVEPNYLDPTPTRIIGQLTAKFAHNPQNGIRRLGSIGSGSGLVSPQATTNSPSPPPVLPAPPPPILSQSDPSSLYANEEALLSALPLDVEHNNNKSQSRGIQRGHSTLRTGLCDDAGPVSLVIHEASMERGSNIRSSNTASTATYMNVDIGCEIETVSTAGDGGSSETASVRGDLRKTEASDGDHAYMNVQSVGAVVCASNQTELRTTVNKSHPRLPALVTVPCDVDDNAAKHCYANLEPGEIDGLRKRISGVSITDRSPLTPSTPTGGLPVREVNYAVLDLDQKDTPGTSSPLENVPGGASAASPPDSPNRLQKGYATIDFNKTAALSHSVNPNLVNDNEGSRKTRHNSTITELPISCRHSSSLSE